MGSRLFLGSLSVLTIVSSGISGGTGVGYSAEVSPLKQQVLEVVDRLVGVMTTAEQAATNPNVSNVRMTTCEVSVQGATEPDAMYLYQEQAVHAPHNNPGRADSFAKPYRQRFLQISPHFASQSVRSLSFRPADATKWIGLCNQPKTARVVQGQDLGKPTCSVFLKRSGEAYVGRTPIGGCPSKVRGAVRVTNQITLQKTSMSTWDRGYDAAGKQVWGAQDGAYQFKKVQP
jgi:hypothetical protein